MNQCPRFAQEFQGRARKGVFRHWRYQDFPATADLRHAFFLRDVRIPRGFRRRVPCGLVRHRFGIVPQVLRRGCAESRGGAVRIPVRLSRFRRGVRKDELKKRPRAGPFPLERRVSDDDDSGSAGSTCPASSAPASASGVRSAVLIDAGIRSADAVDSGSSSGYPLLPESYVVTGSASADGVPRRRSADVRQDSGSAHGRRVRKRERADVAPRSSGSSSRTGAGIGSSLIRRGSVPSDVSLSRRSGSSDAVHGSSSAARASGITGSSVRRSSRSSSNGSQSERGRVLPVRLCRPSSSDHYGVRTCSDGHS